MSARPAAGTIVVVDWRGGRQRDEPGGIRPGIVVESDDLFAHTAYRNVLVVPLTTDRGFEAMAAVVERIEPDEGNGAGRESWALAHHVTSVALSRIRATGSRVTALQLSAIRQKIALAIGAEGPPERAP